MNFKEQLIEFILRYDKSQSGSTLLSYSMAALVIIKVQIELELEKLKLREHKYS